jgi:hypothetical protein
MRMWLHDGKSLTTRQGGLRRAREQVGLA